MAITETPGSLPLAGMGGTPERGTDVPSDWPSQVELILSAIEAGRHRTGPADRRAGRRSAYRVQGWLRLFADGPNADAKVVYTRDVHTRGLGFLTPHRLPLGYGGRIELPTPDGRTANVHCTLLRCREAAPGWFEGSLYFNREQPDLVPSEQNRAARPVLRLV